MKVVSMVVAAAALLVSPALAEMRSQATLSHAPIAANSTFVNQGGRMLGVDGDLTIRLGLAPDREPGY